MGLREADLHFPRAVRAVKAGREVVLTERGHPVAIIKPIRATDSTDAAIERLVGEGRLRLAAARGPVCRRGWKPLEQEARCCRRLFGKSGVPADLPVVG